MGADSFLGLLDAKAKSLRKICWVEKSPMHIRRIPVIRHYAPEARFIHVVRRWRPVLTSWRRVAEANPDTLFNIPSRRIARHWRRDLRRTLRWAQRDSDRHLIVSYENLCRCTEKTLARALAFCGIQNDGAAWRRYTDVAGTITARGENWKKRNAAPSIRPRPEDTLPGPNMAPERLYRKVVDLCP